MAGLNLNVGNQELARRLAAEAAADCLGAPAPALPPAPPRMPFELLGRVAAREMARWVRVWAVNVAGVAVDVTADEELGRLEARTLGGELELIRQEAAR